MTPPFYLLVRFLAPQDYEPVGETWPYGEDWDGLLARLDDLTAATGEPHAAAVVWA